MLRIVLTMSWSEGAPLEGSSHTNGHVFIAGRTLCMSRGKPDAFEERGLEPKVNGRGTQAKASNQRVSSVDGQP